MSKVRTSLITCRQCGRQIMVRAADMERGHIVCSHVGCGAMNPLAAQFYYDETLVDGLNDLGRLTYLNRDGLAYALRVRDNVIGTATDCAVRLERFIHGGQCFISRRHCTLSVVFDKWNGKLRYQLQDGAFDAASHGHKSSLNGTQLNGVALQKNELIDVEDGDIITLGGPDRFRLTHAVLSQPMLATYKINVAFNPDRTE